MTKTPHTTTQAASIRMRVSTTALVLLAIWPVCHFALVQRYELNAWKLFGFAMYAVVEPGMTSREPMAAAPGKPLMSIPVDVVPSAVRPQVMHALATFMAGREYWGGLYDPKDEAAVLFELMPSASVLVLSLDRCDLDVRAIVRCRIIQYRCDRTSGEAVPACAALTAPLAVGAMPKSS